MYGSIEPNKTGLHKINGTFRHQSIQHIEIIWGEGGMVIAVCAFDVEVVKARKLFGLFTKGLQYSSLYYKVQNCYMTTHDQSNNQVF